MEEAKSLGYMLGRTFRTFLNQVATELKKREIELTFEQFVMLRMIYSDGNVIQKDIARCLNKDKSLVVRQMDFLIERGFVVMIPNRDDKRKKNLMLTPKGHNMMEEIMSLNNEVSRKLLAGVDDSEYRIFLQVLNTILVNSGAIDIF
jgi:DNA-binding MarR family transcriptional regulator